jgi:NAD+ diphosphatase
MAGFAASPSRQDPAVTPILASRANIFTGSPLDRAGEKREDAAWIEAAFNHPDALFAPVWRSRNLLAGVGEATPQAVFPAGEAALSLRRSGEPWAFLGLQDGVPVFALDLSAVDEPRALLGSLAGEFTDLRAVADLLPRPEASVLALARGLMHWRSRHRFCGVCGAPCVPVRAGHVMLCTACNTEHFPRTDPAVIMLVSSGDRALLGHSRRFATTTTYSTLAGFVEPGESLEEAVAREVFEESGIRIGRVQYHSSQPWPFPCSIMLGFYAEALTEAITVDPGELIDARWFTREQIRNHRTHGFNLPRPDSIARRLVEDWVAAGD